MKDTPQLTDLEKVVKVLDSKITTNLQITRSIFEMTAYSIYEEPRAKELIGKLEKTIDQLEAEIKETLDN